MRSRTIKEVLADTSCSISPEDYEVYLFRDNDGIVLYAGKAQNTHNRFLTHMGLGGFSGERSAIGEFIYENAPLSDNWLFEEYTLLECQDLVKQYHATQGLLMPPRPNVDTTEAVLIKLHRPHFNVAMNSHPHTLPENYQTSPSNTDYERDLYERVAQRAGITSKKRGHGTAE